MMMIRYYASFTMPPPPRRYVQPSLI
jgi:hypothetical protein